MGFWTLFILLIVAFRVSGIILAADAIMTARTPQGSMAWAIALLVLPELTVLLYLVFGNRRFIGYVKARRRGRLGIDQVATQLIADLAPFVASMPPTVRPSDTMSTMQRLTGLAPTMGNRVNLLIDAEQAYPAIFKAIAEAQSYVVAEFYYIVDDATGKQFRRALCDAAKRGVKVYLIHAGAWALTMPRAALREMRQAQVHLTAFQSRRTMGWWSWLQPWRRFQLNFRNHRKIVVADGRVALMGGMNISDEHVHQHPDPRLRPWRDTHVRIEGPAALQVQLAWLEDWFSATETLPDLNWTPRVAAGLALDEAEGEGEREGESAGSGEGERVQIVPTGPADPAETCGLMFTELFTRARKRLWIATPYFVPDEGTVHALQLAALRGVDVRILIPENYDSKLVWLSAFTYYNQTIPAGAKVFRYQPGFMHQKVTLCDDLVAIGSANLDNRSLRINFEITALIDGEGTARAVEAMFLRDLERARPVARGEFDQKPFFFRLLCMCSRLLAPIE